MVNKMDLIEELYGEKQIKRRYTERSPKQHVYVPTEKEDAKKLIQWAYTQPILKGVIIHIPNEGKRHPWEGRSLGLMGMRAGVSDFFVPIPKAQFHGLWLELKRQSGGVISELQQDWIYKMQALDYAAYIAYGFEDAKKILKDYLALC